MSLVFEKHKRDYSLLGTSNVMEEFCSQRVAKYFKYKCHPMYILVKNENLYHYMAQVDFVNWANSWIKHYSYTDFTFYKKKIDKIRKSYLKFLHSKKIDTVKAIDTLHEYMNEFVNIIIVTTIVTNFLDKQKDKKLLNILVKIRKLYGDIHKTALDEQRKLLTFVAKKYKIKRSLLEYLTIHEYKDFINTKILPKNLSSRRTFVLIEHLGKGSKVLPYKEAVSKLKTLEGRIKQPVASTIKGNVAYRGLACGKVRLVSVIKDASKIKKGEILVTAMTDPRYVPAMKKAAAIVTDEGGITCHAAIVSRELGIPCVIGTKIATQLLKDGDLVEVDANKGLVKILKRA